MTEPQQTREATQAKDLTDAKIVIGVVCLGILGLVVFYSFVGSGEAEPTKGDRVDAYLVCQKFVRARLRAPTTAQFPHSASTDISIITLDDNRFRSVAYVDSQNAFGAMLRSTFTCEVTWTSGREYHLEQLEIH